MMTVERTCSNCKFWEAIPEWAIAKDQGECLRINGHWIKHYETDDPPLINTAMLSDHEAFLVTRGAFGCNMFESRNVQHAANPPTSPPPPRKK